MNKVIIISAALLIICLAITGYSKPTQATQNQSYKFCTVGYARSVRPSMAFSEVVKIVYVYLYGDGLPVRTFELDHVVPIELGGSPYSLYNLQLQSWPKARAKDRLEDRYHYLVCHGYMSLPVAVDLMRSFK